MKYIAINANSFLLITPEMSEELLISEGYVLYTEVEYQDYVNVQNEKTPQQLIKEIEDKASGYLFFGKELWDSVKKKTFAINTYNRSIGIVMSVEDMLTLLNSADIFQKSLESGSFITALQVCTNLKNALPQYSSVADYATAEINNFLGI